MKGVVVVAVLLVSSITRADDSATIRVPAGWVEEKTTSTAPLEWARADARYRDGSFRKWKAPDNLAEIQLVQIRLELIGKPHAMIDEIESTMKRGLPSHVREVSLERKDRLTRVVVNHVLEVNNVTLYMRRIYMVDARATLHQVTVACMELTTNNGATCTPIFSAVELTDAAIQLKHVDEQRETDAKVQVVIEVLIYALIAGFAIAYIVRFSRKRYSRSR